MTYKIRFNDADQPGKPFRYVNRKGTVYFLHSVPSSKQTTRYFMDQSAERALDAVPLGYEVVETPNGFVSIYIVKPRLIAPEEEELVKTQLAARKLSNYRVEVKGLNIIVHEPKGPNDEEIVEMFRSANDELSELVMAQFRKKMSEQAAKAEVESARRKWEEDLKGLREQMTSYSPMLRFRLSNRTKRLFVVARMTFGIAQDWLEIDKLPLPEALARYLRHLGKDSFRELY